MADARSSMTLDFRNDQHLETIAKTLHTRVDGLHAISLDVLINALCDYRNSVDNVDALTWNTAIEGVVIKTRAKSSSHLGVGDLAFLALNLQTLKGLPGFREATSGFRNPTRFLDTAFEMTAAAHCIGLPSVRSLEFEPCVTIGSTIKRPDFLMHTHDDIKVYCECKDYDFENKRPVQSFHNLAAESGRLLENLAIADDERIDIRMDRLPNVPTTKAASSIYDAVANALAADRRNRNVLDVPNAEGVRFRIVSRDADKSFADESTLSLVMCKIGPDKATQLSYKNAYCIFYACGLKSTVIRGIRHLIQQANSALPKTSHGAIFINGWAKQYTLYTGAIQTTLQDKAYDHVITIAMWGAGQPKFFFRTEHHSILTQVFSIAGVDPA